MRFEGYITITLEVRSGRPCIKGTRITVADVLEYFSGGMTEEEIARYWCRKSAIPWLGRADIGHDVGNRVVPFGNCARLSVN